MLITRELCFRDSPAAVLFQSHMSCIQMLKYQRSPNTFSLHLGRNPSEYFLLGTVLLLSHNFSLEICFIGFPHSPSSVRSLFSKSFQSLSESKKQGQPFPFLFISKESPSYTLKQLCSETEWSLLSLWYIQPARWHTAYEIANSVSLPSLSWDVLQLHT